jgi:PPE-repeat protein
MTAPVWMAAPPEVHSALLSSGPGPGSLLAATTAWKALSTAYTETAEELSAVLAAVQAGSWEGPTAEAYVTAHAPYLAWLLQAAANSAATAAQHETAAASYTAALAAMPTLPELALNHAIHGVLVATNFFGINTIPIALNEADYVRMWIQAATTMSTYQAVSGAAVASVPHATPAPQIVKSAAASDPPPDLFAQLLQQLDNLPLAQQIASLFPPGYLQAQGGLFEAIFPFNPFTPFPPGTTIGSLLQEEVGGNISGLLYFFPQYNGATTLIQLIAVGALNLVQYVTHNIFFFTQLVYNYPLLLSAVLPLITAPVGALGGFAGLAGLIHAPAVPAAATPVPVASTPPVALTPVVSTVASPTPTPASAAPALAPTAPPPAPPPPPPPVTGVEAFPYPYLVGPPSIGAGGSMSTSAGAKKKASEPDIAAAAAATATTREKARARRRRATVIERGWGVEYMDFEDDPGPGPGAPLEGARVVSTAASDRGAGSLGFAGTATKERITEAAGLTTLAGDAFGGGPNMPMMPSTWRDDPDERAHQGEGADET